MKPLRGREADHAAVPSQPPGSDQAVEKRVALKLLRERVGM